MATLVEGPYSSQPVFLYLSSYMGANPLILSQTASTRAKSYFDNVVKLSVDSITHVQGEHVVG